MNRATCAILNRRRSVMVHDDMMMEMGMVMPRPGVDRGRFDG